MHLLLYDIIVYIMNENENNIMTLEELNLIEKPDRINFEGTTFFSNNDFSRRTFIKCSFDKLNMVRTYFVGANLEGSTFRNSVLNGVDFTDANLESVKFKNAVFTDVNFSRANLAGAIMAGVNLTGTNLDSAELDGVNLTGTKLGSANLKYALMRNANLRKVNLIGADLTGANLTRANLTGANLTGANFKNASLYEANLTGANLTGANFINANLTGAIMTGTTLSQCDFTGANTIRVDFSRTNVTNALNLIITEEFVSTDSPPHSQEDTVGKLLGKILKIQPRGIDKSKIKKIDNVFTDTVFDVSLATEIQKTNIDKTEDNVTFYIDKQSTGVMYPRQQLINAYKENSSLYIACNKISLSSVPIKIVKSDNVFVRINLTMNFFIKLVDMEELLSTKHREWILEPTEDKEQFTASILNVYGDNNQGNNIFNNPISIVSSDHCQGKTDQMIYKLTPIKFITNSPNSKTKKTKKTKSITDKTKTEKPKAKNCPRGTRRNKKTGECDKVEETVV